MPTSRAAKHRETPVSRDLACAPGSISIGPAAGEADTAVTRMLLSRYAEALPFSLAYQGFAAELAALPGPGPPDGCLLLARRDADCLGTVGLKPLADGIGEIKRLYVVPEARGCGFGRRLLTAVIDGARAKRYLRLRLDSDRASMAAAIALYRAQGFVEIPPYGPDLGGRLAFFETRLREIR
jgi:GNAT superfamily N-acetyltransferase